MTEPEQPALGERKAFVLRAVVEEYVRTGEPVGSETIAELSNLGVSPATIRNELSALEELGYLSHPHTSAGRVPMDSAYRHYVDSARGTGRLKEAQRLTIARFFAETMFDLEETLKGTAHLLSRLTQYAGVAVTPSLSEEHVLRVEIVEVGTGLLVLVVTQSGRVDKQTLDRPEGLEAGAIEDVERRLAESFRGLTLAEAMGKSLEMAKDAPEPEKGLLLALARTFGDMRRPARSEHILVGGLANLAGEAAFWRRETARALVEALESESTVLDVLHDVAASEDLSVTIGGEHPSTGEWDAAVVAAPFRVGEQSLGTVGVVGPTRMDYLSVMASVRAVAKQLSDLASALEG